MHSSVAQKTNRQVILDGCASQEDFLFCINALQRLYGEIASAIFQAMAFVAYQEHILQRRQLL